MRRIHNLILAGLVGVGVSACQPETTISTPIPAQAGVRFLNLVPDTGGANGFDFRFIDIFENNMAYRITYRNTPSGTQPFVAQTIQFKSAQAGSRHFKIFYDDTLQTIAPLFAADTTVTLTASTNYSAILWGNARSAGADKMNLKFITEDVGGDKDTTKVGLRVLNATNAAIDVYAYLQGAAPGATPTWAAVPAYSISSYVFVAPSTYNPPPTSGTQCCTWMFNVRPAGGAPASALFADGFAMYGSPANCDLHYPCLSGEQPDVEAAPGAAVAGSALTAIISPRTVAGSRTPQGASFQVPAITFMWDRRPPRGCKPTLC
jgi:hypothetical protein